MKSPAPDRSFDGPHEVAGLATPNNVALPFGDYTPFGLLRNPAARATSWRVHVGGVLRTMDDALGVEWCYPTASQPTLRVRLAVETGAGERRCASRADFEALGYTARYHTANALCFAWTLHEVQYEAWFWLADDVLNARVVASNGSAHRQQAQWAVVLSATASDDLAVAPHRPGAPAGVVVRSAAAPAGAAVHAVRVFLAGAPDVQAGGNEVRAAFPCGLPALNPRRVIGTSVALARGDEDGSVWASALQAVTAGEGTLEAALAQDAAFHATSPRLSGDWPLHWPNGLHYDLQTTRLCVMEPGGIFRDVWPSWMVAWPRVVLAEGALDMLRLAYADPRTAQRAVLSLFRDAPAANVPCVFQGGEPNMVARDGSVCGTSPAWCLPLLNLERLFLRTLDLDWLRALYPYLEAYLEWWLEQRTDADGWLVYKCTWEAGEDGSPRLDPSGSGDADISGHARPVELQATMCHAAGVMQRLAGWLAEPVSVNRWQAVERAYQARTRALWDPEAGRFRDWLIAEARFQEPRPEERYWGVDARRYGPLSLTPLLTRVSAEQRARLKMEVRRHGTAPWTWWPSWSYVLAECAAAAGLHEWIGEVVWGIVDRVYRQNDRRTLGAFSRPTPGAAREYWPADLRDWQAGDGYGWGATTADLLLRHLLGIQESHEPGWTLDLVPALPTGLRQPGRRYEVRNMLYRGALLDLAYVVAEDGETLATQVATAEPRACRVEAGAAEVYRADRPRRRHAFRLRNGQRATLRLAPGPLPARR